MTTTSPADRSKDTSNALVEIRTVLSRAKTAAKAIRFEMEPAKGHFEDTGEIHEWQAGRHGTQSVRKQRWVEDEPPHYDPDRDEMLAALDAFIAAASRWDRKGRK